MSHRTPVLAVINLNFAHARNSHTECMGACVLARKSRCRVRHVQTDSKSTVSSLHHKVAVVTPCACTRGNECNLLSTQKSPILVLASGQHSHDVKTGEKLTNLRLIALDKAPECYNSCTLATPILVCHVLFQLHMLKLSIRVVKS